MEKNIYGDIAERCGGNIYIGVVGPVRTGKSTFIKSFMEKMVLPNIDDIYKKERAKDELPQSGSGKTVMTSEPKFVPEEAATINLDGKCRASVRLIDCVGYMIPEAQGEYEDDAPRMVSTPWSDSPVTLAEAAETGTKKVICEHSTIGLLVTTDGTIGDIPRSAYVAAEEKTVAELKAINKPFCVLLNSKNPKDTKTQNLAQSLSEKYGVPCKCVNCLDMGKDEIEQVITSVLYQFPVKEYCFTLPEWLMYLGDDNELRRKVYDLLYDSCSKNPKMDNAVEALAKIGDKEQISGTEIRDVDLGRGCIKARVDMPRELFYKMLSECSGFSIENDGCLMDVMRRMSQVSREYEKIRGALTQVKQTGYGIVMPEPEEIRFEEPEIVKTGGRFGVRLKAGAPSIHLIRADIETEINPIVGSEKQSEDLLNYLMSEFEGSPEKIWDTNLFGKSLSELVNEGLNNKLYKMPEEARDKFRMTLQRAINEGSGGLICIIL